MDPRTAASGFLGTGASLAADVALLGYIFLIAPGMLIGFVFARRRQFVPRHKLTMTIITLVNWVFILYLMAVSYSRRVAPDIPQSLNQPFFLSPTVHLLLGGTAQLLATILVLRMWLGSILPARLRFEPIKPWMRLTLGLWLATATLGVVTYLVWYGLPFSGGQGGASGAATQAANVNVAAGPASVTVSLRQFQFVPADITVPVGTTIKFINLDSAPHTVTYADGSVDTGNFFKGDFRELTFDKPGDVKLYCKLHGASDGTGMAMTVHVRPAAEVAALPTVDKAALTPLPPTPAPGVPPPPEQPLKQQSQNQLVGVLSFADQSTFSDTANLQLFNMQPPPSGKVYYGWLTASGTRPLNIGKIELDDKGTANIHQSFARRNLVADYDSFIITTEDPNGTPGQPGDVLYSGKEPPVAYAAIRQIVGKAEGTPNLNGYAVGARIGVDEVVRQGAFIQDLMKIGNLEDAKAHAEAIVNLIRGGPGQDLDGDKSILAPSDGYGLRNYINGGIEAARAAKAAQDATGAIRLHADHVLISGQNALTFLDALEKQALALIAAKTYAEARAPAQSVQELAVTLRDGVDKDNNGTIDPVPGEGAIFSMYDHAQYIAAMAIVSGTGGQVTETSTKQATEDSGHTPEADQTGTPEATQPAATEAAQVVESGKVTIRMLDFEYDKPAVTIKVGTEVTFVGAGAGPRHSATADDNSFDTGLLGPGESKTIRFDKPGKFGYYCALHGGPGGDGMAGTITVVP
jgi:plastocyanin/uncharacterized membrane protein YozB (DUF420 family)